MEKLMNNMEVYGLNESIKASKYPMSTNISLLNSDVTDTVKSLGAAPAGSGHDNFLNGIIVQFDLTFSLKAWTEMQRYHFIAKITNYSRETIRQILNGTRTYTYYKKGKYSFKIFYYYSNIWYSNW